MSDNGTLVAVTYAGTPVDVNAHHKRKKSRVIPPDRRKKVAQACDTCKKRKQKCNGLQPCNLCSSKDLECLYTAIDRRVLKPSKKQLEERRAQDSSPSIQPSSPSEAPSRKKARSVTAAAATESPLPRQQQQQQEALSQQEHHQQRQMTQQQTEKKEVRDSSSSNGYAADMLKADSTSASSTPQLYPQFSWPEHAPNGQLQTRGTPVQQMPMVHVPPQYMPQQYPLPSHMLAGAREQQMYISRQPMMMPYQPNHATAHVASPVPVRTPQFAPQPQPQQLPLQQTMQMSPHGPIPTPPLQQQQQQPLQPQQQPSQLQQPIQNTHSHPQTQQQQRPSNANSEAQSQVQRAHRQSSVSPYTAQPRAQIPASLQPLLSFPLNIQPNEVHDESYNDYVLSTGNDQNWRLLFDEAGNLRYLGESSGTAYLLQCRKLFQRVLGPQKFSDDPERFTYIDAPAIPLAHRSSDQLPERPYTDYLVRTYLNNLNLVLYILDDDALLQLVDRVYAHSSDSNISQRDLCILYLVLAIASVFAQAEISKKLFPFPQDYFTDPFVLFERGMSILNSTTEDDNIWLAEAYLLIFFFYQFTGHKNTAWVKLGSAIRYALGLGLHRKFVNDSYKDPKFVLHRRKLFRSLFIMDTLSSVHLGRSMTIRRQDWDDLKFFDTVDDYQNKLLRVCELNSKILDHVYYNPAVTLKMALKLAVELKIYTLKNPIKPVSVENYPAPVDHKYLLPHVIYLHGIILLSRPFFHFVVLKKLGLVNYDPASKNLPHLKNFYHSCIKASLLIVKIVEYCYYQNIHPFKPLSLVSCTFHAGLVLGLLLVLRLKGVDHEMFQNDPQINVDPEAMLSHAMASVIKVLVHYGKIDPQSKRYATILQNMLDVTKHHPENVDGNDSDSSSHTAQERINTQQNFENILRFQDWLFPKANDLPASFGGDEATRTGYEVSPDSNEDFLKDIAGINNVESGAQFLDDFLYTVIDAGSGTQVNNGTGGDNTPRPQMPKNGMSGNITPF